MSRLAASFPFVFGDDENTRGCWDPQASPPSPFEQKLLRSLPSPTLELLRVHLLQAATETREGVKGARTVVQLAFDTTLRVYLNELVTVPQGVLDARVCERRRYIEIDRDMQRVSYLYAPGITDAIADQVFSLAYAEGVRVKLLAGKDPRTRMGALAVLLCLSTARLT